MYMWNFNPIKILKELEAKPKENILLDLPGSQAMQFDDA